MDVKAVSCSASSHHAVSISPHAFTKAAVPYFTLDYDLVSQVTGRVFWLAPIQCRDLFSGLLCTF